MLYHMPHSHLKYNVKDQKQVKIEHFDKFLMILQVKLFEIIQVNIFQEFFDIRVHIAVWKYLLYNFPILSILLSYLPNVFFIAKPKFLCIFYFEAILKKSWNDSFR